VSDNVERILAAIAGLSEEERARLLERLARKERFPPNSQMATPSHFVDDELEGPADYTIIFDGGSYGNPGPGYGSYALGHAREGQQGTMRLDFGRQMTNNEAEYETLIAGLHGLIGRIEATGRSPAEFALEIRGDSALVIHQVQGTWKTKDDRMRLLRNQARELLARFRGHRLVLQGREESVRALGH
jgi:ribonuclease HI